MELKKQFIVVYDNKNIIITKSMSNETTLVGEGRNGAEFDTQEELDTFIVQNGLKENRVKKYLNYGSNR